MTAELERLVDTIAERARAAFRGAGVDEMGAATEAVQEAGAAAMRVGASFAALAEAEQAGDARARAELEPEAIKAVRRAGGRFRSGRDELTTAARKALSLGVARGEIAREADVSPAVLRTLLQAGDETPLQEPESQAAATADGDEGETGGV